MKLIKKNIGIIITIIIVWTLYAVDIMQKSKQFEIEKIMILTITIIILYLIARVILPKITEYKIEIKKENEH